MDEPLRSTSAKNVAAVAYEVRNFCCGVQRGLWGEEEERPTTSHGDQLTTGSPAEDG